MDKFYKKFLEYAKEIGEKLSGDPFTDEDEKEAKWFWETVVLPEIFPRLLKDGAPKDSHLLLLARLFNVSDDFFDVFDESWTAKDFEEFVNEYAWDEYE